MLTDMLMRLPEIMVGIGGATTAGKTTLKGNLLKSELGGKITLLDTDDFYKSRTSMPDVILPHFEYPPLYDLDKLHEYLQTLKEGRRVPAPKASRESQAAGKGEEWLMPRRIVGVVGFLALYPEWAAEAFDIKIYLELSDEEIVRRRLERARGDHDPNKPWNDEVYIRGALLEAHHEIVVPQSQIPGCIVLDAEKFNEAQLADEVVGIIRKHRATT